MRCPVTTERERNKRKGPKVVPLGASHLKLTVDTAYRDVVPVVPVVLATADVAATVVPVVPKVWSVAVYCEAAASAADFVALMLVAAAAMAVSTAPGMVADGAAARIAAFKFAIAVR
jgi:hypothetical protein